MLSRVADSLYWMARYLERAERTARLMEVNLQLMLDQGSGDDQHRWNRLLDAVRSEATVAKPNAFAAAEVLTLDETNPCSIRYCLTRARDNARQAREEVSAAMFEQLNRVYYANRQASLETIWTQQPYEFFRTVQQDVQLFHGITEATIPHDQEWAFIELGRFFERTTGTARLLEVYARVSAEDAPGSVESFEAAQYLRWVGVLRSCAAFEACQQQYRGELTPSHVLEFLAFDPRFPQSIRFSTERLAGALEWIGQLTSASGARRVERLAGRLRAQLGYGQIDEVLAGDVTQYLAGIQRQCDQIHETIHRVYIAYPIDEMAA